MRVLPSCLPIVVRGWFSKWKQVRDESEPQETSACGRAFILLHRGFQLSLDPPSRLLHCLVQWVSPLFFSLVRRRGQVIKGGRGVIWFFETTSTLGVSRFGSALSQGLVVVPTKAHFCHIARESGEVLGLGRESQMRRGSHIPIAHFSRSWELLQFDFYF